MKICALVDLIVRLDIKIFLCATGMCDVNFGPPPPLTAAVSLNLVDIAEMIIRAGAQVNIKHNNVCYTYIVYIIHALRVCLKLIVSVYYSFRWMYKIYNRDKQL